MLMGKLIEKYYIIQIFKNKICKDVQIFFNELIVKRGKNGTNLTNLSIICYLLWPSLPHFLVLIHWSLVFNKK